MKKQLLLSAAVGVLAAATAAAVTPAMAAPPSVYNWTGFYVGANAGYSWGAGRHGLQRPRVFPIYPTYRSKKFRWCYRRGPRWVTTGNSIIRGWLAWRRTSSWLTRRPAEIFLSPFSDTEDRAVLATSYVQDRVVRYGAWPARLAL